MTISDEICPSVRVLCPMARGGCGSRTLNVELQQLLNPDPSEQVERFGWRFAPGDKVMQVANDYEKEVFNGDLGTIDSLDADNSELTVLFEGKPVVYGWGELDNLVPAYACTIHKSQGSEYPAVVIPLLTQHYAMLQLRGSSDFDTLADYQAFLAEVRDDYNRPRLCRLEQEKAALRPLPPFRFADYDIEQLTVRRTSTIEVRKVVYSVPPRLIGQRLTVRIFHDRLQLLLGRQLACELERLHGGVERHGRAWSIDLEHLIDALRRKPRALLHCRYQQELFPDERWWQLWQQLRNGGDRDAAARLVVEALYVGCRLAGYEPVLTWLEKAHQRQGLSLAALQQRFRLPPHRPLPTQRIPQHPLQSYDDLLVLRAKAPGSGGRPADPVAAAAAGTDPLPLAEHRLAS
ncbi:ATP-dependent RecD-like DNA helicase [Synechococcus sp. CBW1004]|uniref:ATP-dependent DNA helicase n=1 Tax=Synechococcus sp. CBW1004 TaxID=1353136 RepID=UPI001E2DAF4E|nr:ATP-binding domain-containing protein [Synechococcus sp. CBW1004]